MRLIGVDPGTQALGWGVIDLEGARLSLVAYGAVSPPKRAESVPKRLAAIGDALAEIIREQQPELAAVEKAFFGKSATAALRVGEARGVALAELARAGVPVEEVAPTEVKKAVTGVGSAQKRQVQLMVAAILGLRERPEPLDASDALAVAICLAHRTGASGLLRAAGRGSPSRRARRSSRAAGSSARRGRKSAR